MENLFSHGHHRKYWDDPTITTERYTLLANDQIWIEVYRHHTGVVSYHTMFNNRRTGIMRGYGHKDSLKEAMFQAIELNEAEQAILAAKGGA